MASVNHWCDAAGDAEISPRRQHGPASSAAVRDVAGDDALSPRRQHGPASSQRDARCIRRYGDFKNAVASPDALAMLTRGVAGDAEISATVALSGPLLCRALVVWPVDSSVSGCHRRCWHFLFSDRRRLVRYSLPFGSVVAALGPSFSVLLGFCAGVAPHDFLGTLGAAAIRLHAAQYCCVAHQPLLVPCSLRLSRLRVSRPPARRRARRVTSARPTARALLPGVLLCGGASLFLRPSGARRADERGSARGRGPQPRGGASG